MVRIAIDAMGGDHAPANVVEGAIRAADRFDDHELILVGREERIREEIARQGGDPRHFEIVHAQDVVAMHDTPVDALRKKPDSSIRRMVSMMKAGECDAVFSAGNTGAMVAASQMLLGLLPGVRRAGIAVPLPRGERPVVLMDVGANVQCKPQHLVHYGVMARELASRLYGVEQPRIGLLNVGEEEQKGNQLAKETTDLFRATPSLNYVGNVEGGDIFGGKADVVVCDGFVGNIVLKVSEGLCEFLMQVISGAFREMFDGSAAGGESNGFGEMARGKFKGLMSRFDYAEYGGAPLLGVDGIVIIGHGRSDARAIANAVRWARRIADARVNDHIVESIQ
ncbi:MAG: phosphate acyltransferase PlsX [Planctomycetes bacterium]|nr:phosphate acyltransferase PlsX [Planctomycetota bacterium]